MRLFYKIESLSGTLVNIVIFVIAAYMFILVFFYPEYAGMLFGIMTKGFMSIVKGVK
jgi:hypothetical protein